MSALTIDAPVITDAVRLANTQGDGRAQPDSSMGFWPQRTNKVPNGGAEANTTGCQNNQATVISRDTTIAKFGGASFRATCNDNTRVMSVEVTDLAGARITVTAGQTYAFSVFNRDGGNYGKSAQLKILWYDSGGSNIGTATGAVGAVPSGFRGDGSDRLYVIGSAPVGAVSVRLSWTVTSNNAINDFYCFDGWQFEQGGWPTPYINTSAGTVTRNGGNAYLASDVYNRLSLVQGWIAFRYRPEVPITVDTTMNMFAFGINSDLTKMMELTWRSNASATTSFATCRRASAAGAASATKTNVAWTPGTAFTLVMFWTSTQIGVSVNGSAFVTTNIALTAFTPNYFIFGDSVRGPNDQPANGEHLWCLIGNGTITQADSATLHANGDADPSLAILGSAAQTIALVPFTNNIVYTYLDAPVETLAATSGMMGSAKLVFNRTGTFAGLGTMTNGHPNMLVASRGTLAGTSAMTGKPALVYNLSPQTLAGSSGVSGHPSVARMVFGVQTLAGLAAMSGAPTFYRSPSRPYTFAGVGTLAGAGRVYKGETRLLGVSTGSRPILEEAK